MELIFDAIAIKDNIGYASNYNGNGLFKVDMRTSECEYLCTFPEEKMIETRLFSKAVWIDECIYFIPAAANALHIYNIENNEIVRIEIPEADKKRYPFYRARYKFIDALKYEGLLWLIPSSYPGILCLDCINNNLTVKDDWIPTQGYFFRSEAFFEGAEFLIPDGKSNLLMIFNMKEGVTHFERLGRNNNGMMRMCKVNDDFYFAPRLKGSILRWNRKNGRIVEYSVYPDSFSNTSPVFSNCFPIKNRIHFSPAKANDGLVLENEELNYDSVIAWNTGKNIVEYLFHDDKYFYYREMIGENDNRTYKINRENGKSEEVAFYVKDSICYKADVIQKATLTGECIKENRDLKFEDFLNSLI